MKKIKYRQPILALTMGALGSFVSMAMAQQMFYISAVPTAWRLQSYGGSATLWYTGSSCASGELQLPAAWSIDQTKLLWATISTAKASQMPVYIGYSVDSTGACIISNFALDAQ